MIDLILTIPDLNIELLIFKLDTSKNNLNEVQQAFVGEREYNNTIFDFDKIEYEVKNVFKTT